MDLYDHTASDAEVSVVVDSTCGTYPSPSYVYVSHSPVTLTCCVEKCTKWTGQWYRRTDNGTNQFISTESTLSVNITKAEEMFICAIFSDDKDCHDDPSGQGNVTLKKCNA